MVEYPADWCAKESEDLVTLYRPETGIGALQISAFRTPGQQDTRELLVEYLSDKDLRIISSSIIVQEEGIKEVSTYDYMDGDWYRHVWVISQGAYLLFVTYNCKAADMEKEINSVLNIVSSLKIESNH